MTRMNTYRRIPNGVAPGRISPFEHPRTITRSYVLRSIIHYAFYAFIFTIPFESVGFADDYLSLSKISGLFFVLTAFLSARMCFRRPPMAFWYFFGYLSVVAVMIPFQQSDFISSIISRLITMTQLLILFWISCNLLGDERVVKGVLLALIMACTAVAILMLLGVGSADEHGRETALEANPNTLSTVLSLGLLALLGLAFGRQKSDFKTFLFMALCSGILAIQIVRTGSRGSLIALIVGFLAFPMKRTKSLASRFGLVLVGALAIGSLVWTSYRSESVRERWERTFATGDTAGRDTIFSDAWDMFLEKPMLGWGPVTHLYELGSRLGREYRDPHNLYLWVLTETGILGAIPFFIGLWLTWKSAWRARDGLQGVLPLAMLVCLLISNVSGTLIDRKLFWIVLAYALASAYYTTYQKRPIGSPRKSQPASNRPMGLQAR